MGVTDLMLENPHIYLDANIFIYMLEGYEEFAHVLTRIFGLIDKGALHAITSELTLAETLVKPITDKNQSLEKIYKELIQTSSVLTVAPITRHILAEAATLRANTNNTVRLPDAIHMATAHANNCSLFLTNDKKLTIFPNIQTVLLSEIKNSDSVLSLLTSQP